MAVFRIVSGVISSIHPITSPHTWRQVDTLSVAFRYWQRWTLDTDHTLWFFPAVLNSSDKYGFMLMEFPLLNIFLAPAFFLGIETGRSAAHLILIFLVVVFCFLNFKIWQKKSLLQTETSSKLVAFAAALFPFFSFCSAFTFKCIPDVFSVQLVLLGLGLFVSKCSRKRLIYAVVCVILGCLIKPVSIFVFGFFIVIFHETNFKLKAKVIFLFTICAFSCWIYYTKLLPHFSYLVELAPKFAVKPRGFLDNLQGLKGESFIQVLDFFNYHLMAPWVLVLLLFVNYARQKLVLVVGVVLLQIVSILLVDGPHAFVHAYYFSALAPLFLYLTLKVVLSNRLLGFLILLLIFVRNSENTIADFKNFNPASKISVMFAECATFKFEFPNFPWGKNLTFRSSNEIYPLLGLCFGERQDSNTSDFGFYYGNDPLPSDCREIARKHELKLADCSGKTSSTF